MNEHMRMSKRERYERMQDWPVFKAVQRMYRVHNVNQWIISALAIFAGWGSAAILAWVIFH